MAVNMWGALCTVLARITFNYDFNATSILFLVGILLIYCIVFCKAENRYDILLIDTNNYEILS